MPPPPDIGILLMNHAINKVEINNELQRIKKKRSLGLRKSKIQTKRRKLINRETPDLEVVGNQFLNK